MNTELISKLLCEPTSLELTEWMTDTLSKTRGTSRQDNLLATADKYLTELGSLALYAEMCQCGRDHSKDCAVFLASVILTNRLMGFAAVLQYRELLELEKLADG